MTPTRIQCAPASLKCLIATFSVRPHFLHINGQHGNFTLRESADAITLK